MGPPSMAKAHDVWDTLIVALFVVVFVAVYATARGRFRRLISPYPTMNGDALETIERRSACPPIKSSNNREHPPNNLSTYAVGVFSPRQSGALFIHLFFVFSLCERKNVEQ
jgi:hypothetical protein